MTCLQEIILRLALAIRELAAGRIREALPHVESVIAHLAEHGAKEGSALVACKYEGMVADVGGRGTAGSGPIGAGVVGQPDHDSVAPVRGESKAGRGKAG